MKDDLRQYLAEEHVSLATVPSTLTGYHKFPAGTTALRPAATANSRRIYFNTTTGQIDIENLGTTSFPEGTPGWSAGGFPFFPTGTALVFYQATPPSGWTAVAVNDMTLRVVSSGATGGTTGGTTPFSTAFAGTTTGAEAAHTHSVGVVGNTNAAVPGGSGGTDLSTVGASTVQHIHAISFTVTSGAGSSHTHTIPAFTPQFADVVIASKD